MELIAGIGGIVLGFLLNEFATWIRQSRTDREQAKVIREMLRLEIEQNLVLLRSFWSQVNQQPSLTDQAFRFAYLPLPIWNHKVLESQLTPLPRVLKEEKIKGILLHHNQLDIITVLRARMAGMYADLKEDARAAMQSQCGVQTRGVSEKFLNDVALVWTECERVVNETLSNGNPLANKDTKM